MSASAIIFYLISAFTIIGALLAVTTAKIFRAAIWLLFSLVGIASLYFWMRVEFIAAVQIIVYVGGIAVLIIFSVFLTNEPGKEMPKPIMKRKIFSVLAALFGFAFSFNLINQYAFPANSATPFIVSVSDIGTQMLSTTAHGYILPFEVVSFLLLAAMIGCIVIAMKNPEDGNADNIISPEEKKDLEKEPSQIIYPPVPAPMIIEEIKL
jgi:NADH-quinone oxidoreductase subunit J